MRIGLPTISIWHRRLWTRRPGELERQPATIFLRPAFVTFRLPFTQTAAFSALHAKRLTRFTVSICDTEIATLQGVL